jgi:hypothetical protein
MASLRTAEQVEAEYAAARNAYLQAVKRQSYSISTGQLGSRSVESQRVADLRNEMEKLEIEYRRLTSTAKGLKVRGVTPV